MRPRSPFEKLIDEACGFDPDAPPGPVGPPEPMSDAWVTDARVTDALHVVDKAMAWALLPHRGSRHDAALRELREACRALRKRERADGR